MAEVMNSLFGITPESLMAQREAALAEQATKYAQLSPMQAAQAGFYTAGNRLAGAVGGMLGGQDPELMQLTQRRTLLQQAQPVNAKGWSDLGSQLMQAGDIQGAQEAYNKAQTLEAASLEARKTESIISKNNADKQGATLQDKVFLALASKATPASVKTAQMLDNDITQLDIPESVKISTYGQVLKDAGLTPGTPEYQKQMQAFADAELESTRKGKGANITNVLPGVKEAGDVTGLRKDIQSITKPYQDKADAANDAIGLANMAIKTKNFAAAASLSRSLSKAAGDQQITAGDVAAYGIDPSLVGTVSDTLSRFATGVPTADTLIQLRKVAEVIEAKNKGRIQQEEEQTMNVARASKLFTEDQIQTVFPRRPKDTTAGKTSFNSVAEAEAAKLPKGTIITINGRRARVE